MSVRANVTSAAVSSIPLAVRIVVGATVLFLICPVLIIIPISFTSLEILEFPPAGFSLRWYAIFLADDQWRAGFLQSLVVGSLTVVTSLLVGVPAALALFNTKLAGRRMLFAIALTPLVTPVIVLAIGDFMVLSRWHLAGTTLGLVMAHMVLAVPLVLVSVTASLQTINANLAAASSSLGAGPIRTFVRITLPLLGPGITAGAVFAFITSWDEVVMAIFLTDPSNKTLPVLIWNSIRTGLSPVIAAVGTILIAVSVTALLIVQATTGIADRGKN